eukprot:1156720-Pelagomonas_calceolata.AAC.2
MHMLVLSCHAWASLVQAGHNHGCLVLPCTCWFCLVMHGLVLCKRVTIMAAYSASPALFVDKQAEHTDRSAAAVPQVFKLSRLQLDLTFSQAGSAHMSSTAGQRPCLTINHSDCCATQQEGDYRGS